MGAWGSRGMWVPLKLVTLMLALVSVDNALGLIYLFVCIRKSRSRPDVDEPKTSLLRIVLSFHSFTRPLVHSLVRGGWVPVALWRVRAVSRAVVQSWVTCTECRRESDLVLGGGIPTGPTVTAGGRAGISLSPVSSVTFSNKCRSSEAQLFCLCVRPPQSCHSGHCPAHCVSVCVDL